MSDWRSSGIATGRAAWIFGDDLDVDLVIGVENIKLTQPEDLHRVVMRSFDPDFTDKVRQNDFFIGGRNFGYGHPHFVAMTAARNEGIIGVLAESFSPGFWRGEIGTGMLLLEVPGISDAVNRWDELCVYWKEARVEVGPQRREMCGTVLSPTTIATVAAGGRYEQLLRQHQAGKVTVARAQP